jgi:hypothetical protein
MALVMLRSYRDPIDAELAKSRLESAGIPALILDKHLASIQWLYSNAIGGAKIEVDESDLDASLELLQEEHSADLAEIPESQSPPVDGDLCPVCSSSMVRASRVHRTAAALSLATSLPFIAWRRRWVCTSCNHSWVRAKPPRSAVPERTLEAEQLVHEERSYPILPVMFAVILGLAILWYVQIQIRQSS